MNKFALLLVIGVILLAGTFLLVVLPAYHTEPSDVIYIEPSDELPEPPDITYPEPSDTNHTEPSDTPYAEPSDIEYTTFTDTTYTVSIPKGWIHEGYISGHDEMMFRSMVDGITDGRYEGLVGDISANTYTEPTSIWSEIPTDITISVTPTTLTSAQYDVYQDAASDVLEMLGAEVRSVSRETTLLDGRAAIHAEYVILAGGVNMLSVQVTSVTDGAAYEIILVADEENYDANMKHFEHAVQSFRFE